MKHIGFKIYPWFFDQLANGRRTWDARLDDMSEDRIYALHFASTRDAGPKQDVETITFASTEDHTMRITFLYDRMEFVDWAPGWCFLILGERVTEPNEDVYFGPDDSVLSPGLEARRQRAIGRAVVVASRRVLPWLVDRLPERWQGSIRTALPCVFEKSADGIMQPQIDTHVQCYCTVCNESYNSAVHHLKLGTHIYQAPEDCRHPAVPNNRMNDWVL